MSEPWVVTLACEYCGQPTPWDLRLCVPACCHGCRRTPLVMGVVCLVFSVGLIAASIFAMARL